MKRIATILLSISMVACGRQSMESHTAPKSLEPFPGIDLAELSPEDRTVIEEASEDFQAVLSGKKPVHAVFDKNIPTPSDGGTTFYQGKHYRLTVNITLVGIGNSDTALTAFGPRLMLDEKIAPGFNQDISDIRLYNNEQLRALLADGGL